MSIVLLAGMRSPSLAAADTMKWCVKFVDVVADKDVVADEFKKFRHGLGLSRLPVDASVIDVGESGDRRRYFPFGVDEKAVCLYRFPVTHSDGTELDDAVIVRREPSGFHVDSRVVFADDTVAFRFLPLVLKRASGSVLFVRTPNTIANAKHPMNPAGSSSTMVTMEYTTETANSTVHSQYDSQRSLLHAPSFVLAFSASALAFCFSKSVISFWISVI